MNSEADLFITGWGHTPFGKLDQGLEQLVVEATTQALSTSGLNPGQIDGIYLGQFNAGMEPLAFASSLVLQAFDDFHGLPATRVENACASGSAAVHQAMLALLSGRYRNVLVVGAEKMSHAGPTRVGAGLLGADYELAGTESSTGFAGLFAKVATSYSQRYGQDISETLAIIAAKSHHNAMDNPYAHLRKELDVEFCRTVSERNPLVAGPLRRTDCSPVSDGAAALVLSRSTTSAASTSPIRIRGFAHANDYLPSHKRDPLAFVGTEKAWNEAIKMADVGLDDLDLLELHDCFTIAELNLYEVLGLAERGAGRRALADGSVYRGGRLPVNLSGGLKSKGHPVGATGVSQHVTCAMQLSGTAGGMQLDGARLAAVQNMGGLAVANYVTVLEATS